MPDLNRVILRGVVSDAPESQTFQQGTRKRVRFTVHTTTMEREDGGAGRERGGGPPGGGGGGGGGARTGAPSASGRRGTRWR